jgi:hypothetical protein
LAGGVTESDLRFVEETAKNTYLCVLDSNAVYSYTMMTCGRDRESFGYGRLRQNRVFGVSHGGRDSTAARLEKESLFILGPAGRLVGEMPFFSDAADKERNSG